MVFEFLGGGGVHNVIKIWRQNFEICQAFFRIWPPNFFKGLTQNSTGKLKVEIKFYVDSENVM